MKKIIITSVFVLAVLVSFCQVPNGFNYQAVLRNSSGDLISNQSVDIEISIIDDNSGGPVLYTETHTQITNAYGLVNLVIGTQTPDYGVFSDINWGLNDKFISIKVDGTDMGTFQLLTVPFAMHAALASNLGSENVYTGTDTLFVVKDAEGNPVFVVFPDGAKVIVEEATKGTVGGFAVSGRSPTKADETEIFHVTPDSTRIFVNDTIQSKGTVGGFAVSGRSPTKGITNEYLVVTMDSTRVYVSDSLPVKGRVGGFAVSGRSPTKTEPNNIFVTNSGNTQIYVKDTIAGFGINDMNSDTPERLMNLDKKNYFIGHQSGTSNVDGIYNLFLGYNSGKYSVSGDANTFIGYDAGYNNNGTDNIGIGEKTLYSNTGGGENIAIGNSALSTNYSGNSNIAIGDNALQSNYGGTGNIAIGEDAMINGTGGQYNIAIGRRVMRNNTTGEDNVAIGREAGDDNEGGYYNVFLGTLAGADSNSGHDNVNIGYNSAPENEDGDYNVFIGSGAGLNLTGGDGNVFLGYDSRCSSNMSIANSMALGNGATITQSNMIRIGNSSVTLIQGQVAWSYPSDKRLKENISEFSYGLEFINQLKPINYSMISDQNHEIKQGLIAQDVDKAANSLGFNFSGVNKPKNKSDFYSLSYSSFVIPLINSVNELNERLEKAEKENQELKQKLNEIIEMLNKNQ